MNNTISLKQLKANQKNSQLSTGPKTEEGKSIASKNAIKHGIFSKNIIICTKEYKENEQEYKELLENLIADLKPTTQMESLLVEKICIDYWRLLRVIRFETSSIEENLYNTINNYFNNNNTIEELNNEIKKIKERLDLNNKYISYLEKGIVSFDQPIWKYRNIEANIEEDLFMIIEKKAREILNEDELSRYKRDELYFEEIRDILSKNGYSEQKITQILIKSIKEENENYSKNICRLKNEKKKTKIIAKIIYKNCSWPGATDIFDKIMRYEIFSTCAIRFNGIAMQTIFNNIYKEDYY
ncbi:MAG: hypothetical protein ACMUJM_23305, partial [bacterium]